MSFEINFYNLRCLEIVYKSFTALFGANCNGVPISTKRNATQLKTSHNLFDFFAFNNVEEVDLFIETDRAH